MVLTWFDYLLVVIFLLVSLYIGLKYKDTAGKSLSDFFLGGKNLPWYIAGISMVATTFAADTPLAVTELVSKNGISGNWIWWNMLTGGMLTVFFFARYWRRANVLTELEFIELRYGGKPAAFLRMFKAVYLGIFINTLVIAWVNLALMSILQVFFGIPYNLQLFYVALAMITAMIYSALGGLKSVAITDVVQFVIAMTGSIVLAVMVINSDKLGGIAGLKSKLPESSLDFFPSISSVKNAGTGLSLSLGAFFAFVGIQWWASWYPGAEPGGGGYIAQRMMSAKNEKHSFLATFFFQLAHYAIRPWPWLLVALAGIVLYPDLPDNQKRLAYVLAIKDFLPSGLKGLVLVSLLAAYMSTISTQLNWGASFIVNDIFKRFVKNENEFTSNNEAQKNYVLISRITTVVIMIISLLVTTQIESISGVWSFLLECGAGLGLVLILRWYWWRINAYAEITATFIPFLFYAISKFYLKLDFPESYFFTVGLTTISWLIVSFVTPAESLDTLKRYVEQVKPAGLWNPIYRKLNLKQPNEKLTYLFIAWISSVIAIYSVLFFTGKLIFHEYLNAFIWLIVSIIMFLLMYYTYLKSRV